MHIEEEDQYSDAALIRAARKRLLSELEPSMRKAEHHAKIVNNVYNSGFGGGGGGLSDHLGGGSTPSPEGEDPFSYYVDITRKDLPDINPATGKPVGWTKEVARYKKRKGGDEKKK